MSDFKRNRFHHDETPKLNMGSGLGPFAVFIVIILAVLYFLFT